LTGIIGPNGCGKSTLLKSLIGLLKPLSGDVLIDGKSIFETKQALLAKKIAYLPQNPDVPAGMKVSQILEFGRHPHRGLFSSLSKDDKKVIADVCEEFSLGDLLSVDLSSLSGGQRQRVWLAMTLVQDTSAILLDEPTSALDVGHQIDVLESVKSVVQNKGKTVGLVIHDLNMASKYCDHIIALNRGVVVTSGNTKDVLNEELIQSLYEANMLGMKHPKDGTRFYVPN
jgi:iron complex transport system ATP-binding protein